MARINGWLRDFANYRHTVNESRIDRWLSQFDLPHIDLAARVLDSVDFIGNEKIAAAFRSGLSSIDGWHRDESQRKGIWRFAAFSSSAGESGDVMLQRFRHANNLAGKRYNELFVHRSELPKTNLGTDDKIVLVDDFSGTGNQVTDAWPLSRELMPEGPDIHLLLVAATENALKKISTDTELLVQAEVVLHERDAVFSDACDRFSKDEKAILKKYCERAANRGTLAFGEQGNVLVFSHTCPNNSLAILHSTNADWEGLFRRYD